ncbi:MAG: GDSL-type esterase/lipase family protein [Polyangiales bacterium]
MQYTTPQDSALKHLTIVTVAMLAVATVPYFVPSLSALRPWIPNEQGTPVVRLFNQWGEIPAFAGHGGSYRASTTSAITTDRLAETVGESVAANLGPGTIVDLAPDASLGVIDPSEYAGIDVFIEDPTGRGMAPFYAALEATANEHEGAVTRVGHYGDSSIATDLITSTVRQQLQARFGDAGHGFVIAAKGTIPYKHRGVRQSSNEDNWITREVVRRQDRHGRYGYGGVQSRAKRGAWAKVSTVRRGDFGTRASTFDIYYQAQPRGGTFSVRIDDGNWDEVSTEAEALSDGVHRVEAPDGPHELHVRYTRGGPVHFYGFVVERDGPGVVYDSLGLVGARANRLLNFSETHIAQQLKQRGAHLVVLGFGGNEASDDKTEEQFYEDYAKVLAHVRQGRDDLGCLVVSPLDQASRTRGRIRTLDTIPRIVAAQRRAAFDSGCAFYNTWEAMGGEDAMRRWYRARPRLAMGDFRHATPAGYEIIGNMLYKALLAGFANYLAAASGDAASADAGPATPPSEAPDAEAPSSNAESNTSPSR